MKREGGLRIACGVCVCVDLQTIMIRSLQFVASYRTTAFVSVRLKNATKPVSVKKVQSKLATRQNEDIELSQAAFGKLYCLLETPHEANPLRVMSFMDMWRQDYGLTTSVLFKMPCFMSKKKEVAAFLLQYIDKQD